MLLNLKAEMARSQVRIDDIARELNRSPSCVAKKLAGKTAFTFPEAVRVHDVFFPSCSLEYLFSSEPAETV